MSSCSLSFERGRGRGREWRKVYVENLIRVGFDDVCAKLAKFQLNADQPALLSQRKNHVRLVLMEIWRCPKGTCTAV
jgi:hypothetical protein